MFRFDSTATRRAAARTALFSLLMAGGSCLSFANVSNPGSRHPLLTQVVPQTAQGQQVRSTGRLDGARTLDLVIHLPPQDPNGLSAFLQQLQDPGSANYHKYLSVAQFTERFGPAQSDYDQVVAWANANGLTVTHTSVNRHIIDVTATVDAIDQALNVTMQSYQPVDTDGKSTLFAPNSEPSVALSVPILKISGLDNFNPPQRRLERNDGTAPVAHTTGSGPGGTFLPSDMRAAYYGAGPLTGTGQTIAIFSFDGYLRSDVPLFYSALNIANAPNVPITDVPVNGYSGVCDAADGSELTTCDDGEQVLDIVNSIGMAPGVSEVLFYEGQSGPDILNQIATDNLAKIISCSWGSTDLGGDDVLFQEFQAQGQTYVNATGDSKKYSATSWLPPSLNPWVLQVGGTDLATTAPGGGYASETGWPDSGGGFYAPAGYNIPPYQQLTGVVTVGNHASSTLRNDPDVSAEANFDNSTVSNGAAQIGGFGGTSFAAPRWAGFVALVNEQSAAKNDTTAGFINPSLYAIGIGANYTSNFHDVKTGNNGFAATTGYDLVTGWGSPNGQSLIDTLVPPPGSAGFVVSAYPSIPNVVRGSGATTTVTIGTPDGFSGNVTLSADGLPSGVTASFNPAVTTPSTPSTLTLSATAGATVGVSTVTITGTAGAMQRSVDLKLTVGDAPSAVVPRNPFEITTQPNAKTVEQFSIGDAAGSVPLDYTIAAFASSDGSCTGSLTWLTTHAVGSTVQAGDTQNLNFYVHPGALAVGTYNAELCLTIKTTPDRIFGNGFENSNANLVVPVVLNIVAGPVAGAYTVDQPVENDQAGSALDLATGSYHTWNAFLLDNINLYNDAGNGLAVYWYNNVITGANKNKVGGVYDAGSAGYKVLQSGDVVGPTSTFNRTVSDMTNFFGGVDGYIGIAFVNSQTHALNYGWIYITTSSPDGFPAQVLEYQFDSTGAAVTIP
jgi:subtilase family serine protease